MEITENEFARFNSVKTYEKIEHLILSALIISALAAMAIGVIITVFNFKIFFTAGIENALHTIILNILSILAVLEIYKAILIYFSEGRIKVTYILDTVIVTVLTEMIGFLFKEIDVYKIGMLTALVFVLCIMRIFTTKYSPSNSSHE